MLSTIYKNKASLYIYRMIEDIQRGFNFEFALLYHYLYLLTSALGK